MKIRTMPMETMKNSITLSAHTVQRIGGMVLLPLRKWEEIEEDLEDLEMYRSESLTKEIEQRREDKATIPLEQILKKHNI